MNYSATRPRVLEIVAIIIRGQQRIHHGDHGADTRGAKPRPNKFRTIGQNYQDPIFHLNAGGSQLVSASIAHPRGLAISVSLIFEVEAVFVFATLLQIVIEEVVGHVEAFREFNRHESSVAQTLVCDYVRAQTKVYATHLICSNVRLPMRYF